MISNLRHIRRDGKVIPETMTAVQMIAAGWEPDKVLWIRWDSDGHPIELASPFGFLSRVVASREYIVVLEDTDATGNYATLSTYLSDGTLHNIYPNIVHFPATATWPACEEPGEYLWFQTPKSPIPTAFAVVFKLHRNSATFQVDIDAATTAVLRAEEIH